MSNRLLFEVADSTLIFNWPNRRKPEAQGISILNGNTGFRYNAPLASSLGQRVASQSNQRASLSYVTGSHAFKVGFTTQEAWHHAWYDDGGPAAGARRGPRGLHLPEQPAVADHAVRRAGDVRRTPEGQPRACTSRISGRCSRLTLNLGLRYDYFNAYVPEQNLTAGPVRAGAQLRQGRVRAVLEGHQPADGGRPTTCSATARPAIKVNLGRYVAADIYTQARANNPVTRAVLNAVADLDRQQRQLRARLRSAESRRAEPVASSGGDVCGALNNVNFGKNNPNATTYARRYADRIRGPLAQLADADHVRSAAAPQHLAGRRLLPDRVGRLLRHPEHRGGPGAGRLHAVSASRRRPTRGCPAAAAIRFATSTTWCRASSARPRRRLARADGERQSERGLQRLRRRAEHPAARAASTSMAG